MKDAEVASRGRSPRVFVICDSLKLYELILLVTLSLIKSYEMCMRLLKFKKLGPPPKFEIQTPFRVLSSS